MLLLYYLYILDSTRLLPLYHLSPEPATSISVHIPYFHYYILLLLLLNLFSVDLHCAHESSVSGVSAVNPISKGLNAFHFQAERSTLILTLKKIKGYSALITDVRHYIAPNRTHSD